MHYPQDSRLASVKRILVPVLVTDQLIVRHARILDPEARAGVSDDAAETADAGERVAQRVLDVGGHGQEQGLGAADDERDGGGEDHDGDEEGGERVEARPAVEVHQQGGDDDRDGAEGVGEDVQEDAVHVVAVVVVAVGVGWGGFGWRWGW